MRKMQSTLIALIIGFALIVGACGASSSDSETPDDSGATTTSTTTVTVAPTTTSAPEPTTTTVPPATTTTTTTTAPPSGVEVMIYLSDPDPDDDEFFCEAVAPVTRMVEAPDVLAGAMAALLQGPTAEELAAGYDGWFSSETGWSVESVTISDGVAYIDFAEDSPLIPNASTSCGSMALRAQLDSTAMQFPTVEKTMYSFGGDQEAFYHWLQSDVPQV